MAYEVLECVTASHGHGPLAVTRVCHGSSSIQLVIIDTTEQWVYIHVQRKT